MARLTPRERWLLVAAAALYAAVIIPVGVRRGGDLVAHFPEADDWLRGLPLYASAPRLGIWWPPFATLLVVPFAAVAHASAAVAKGAWAAASVACIGWSVVAVPRERWRPVLLAVAAVAVPLNRNFEDLNLNAILLALVVAAAADLERGRETRSGAWIGAATALKVFPGLLLVYLAYRRRWRAAAAGAAVAAACTIGALLPYGVHGALHAVGRWLANSAPAGWTLPGSNQSLAALAPRLGLPPAAVPLLDLASLALAVVALRRPKVTDGAFEEVAVVMLAAVLLSPIAWVHYFLLALPAWVVALRLPHAVRPAPPWRAALVVCGIATSGVLTVWSLSFRRELFELSIYTWGALLLLVVLAFAPRAPQPATAPS